MKLLLHACCGPCSLEPVCMLQEQGHHITIAFANPNIQPRAEYDRRLDTLRAWADEEGIEVVDLPYTDDVWHAQVGSLEQEGRPREDRCRACYHLRLHQAAAYGAEHGFEALSTTLAVSPYQYFEVCHEELEDACAQYGLACVWQDFRPYYPQATQRSREKGMYRQNFCGCVYSRAEAQAEREQRAAQKAQAAAEREEQLARQRKERAAQHAVYAEKQARKRAARDAVRKQARQEIADEREHQEAVAGPDHQKTAAAHDHQSLRPDAPAAR